MRPTGIQPNGKGRCSPMEHSRLQTAMPETGCRMQDAGRGDIAHPSVTPHPWVDLIFSTGFHGRTGVGIGAILEALVHCIH